MDWLSAVQLPRIDTGHPPHGARAASWRWLVPLALLAWQLGCSALAMRAYAKDKRAARRGLPRIREARLRRLERLGGAYGAVLAQQLLHHKTRKPGFRSVTLFWAALHAAALCGLCWWAARP
ncbi:MAG: hypothetical protein KatS3mg103_0055 [Phycisphaerales bacterium]|nr:MAG: hypothetical protein KatS3mg103_0055 [Phycisphaerales bacterium]